MLSPGVSRATSPSIPAVASDPSSHRIIASNVDVQERITAMAELTIEYCTL